MLVVLTDGDENSSTEVRDVKKIAEMVKERETAGWEVAFLGADLANWQGSGSGMGFSKMSNVSKGNMKHTLKKMSNHTAMYRSAAVQVGATMDSESFDQTYAMSEEDLDKQMKDLQEDKDESKS